MIVGLNETHLRVKTKLKNSTWSQIYSHLKVEKKQKFDFFFRKFLADDRVVAWSPYYTSLLSFTFSF